MKKTIAVYLAILLVLTLCACGAQNRSEPDETVSEPASTQNTSALEPSGPAGSNDTDGIDNSATSIGVMTQEYVGDNIAEILMITYDGSQPALEEFGGKNPEIETINNTIKNGVQQLYLEFMKNSADSHEWIEIKSYPFTSDDYLQIVTSYIVYPTYGTSGDIESYNFNKKENRFVTLQDAMHELSLTEEKIAQNAKELYEPEYQSMSVGEVTPAGFIIRQGEAGTYTIFLLEILLDNSEAEPRKGLFAYAPQSNELYELEGSCLFDPYDMDEMDPPLSYGREPAFNGLE